MPTLAFTRDGALVPVWRDGDVLDGTVRARARPLVEDREPVRVTPESRDVPAGWGTLEQAVATLRALYDDPLGLDWDGDPEALDRLYRHADLGDLPVVV